MRIIQHDLQFYVDLLKTGKKYSFARFGNGEWGCILGTARHTGSGSQMLKIPALQRGLADSLKKRHATPDTYFLGIQSPGYLKRCRLLGGIKNWERTVCPWITWHNGNVFHHASWKGRLHPLIAQLRKMNLIVVGPLWLKTLKKVFPQMQFVQVQRKDCFATYKQIYQGIKRALRACPIEKGPVVISFSAGPTTKVLIHGLHDMVREGCYLIDFGSLWDPYCGKRSRRYHKRITPAIIKRNLTGKK